jgi:glutathione peroxidase
MTTLHDFTVRALDGSELDLGQFKGKAVLVVNVASRCGFTPQYKGLQALWAERGADGLVVLGVPANEFGAQEPGTEADIKGFCDTTYGVTFPMTRKLVVKGEGQHPLYAWLTAADGAGDVRWNFEKFLVGKDGAVVSRFRSNVAPESRELRAALDVALGV